MKPFDVTLLGAGSFGTAVAVHLARLGHQVVMWGKNPKQLQQMADHRINHKYLPNINLPDNIHFERDIMKAINMGRHLILAIPSHAFQDVLNQITQPIEQAIWLTKGIDPSTNKFLHQLILNHTNKCKFGVLSGPSFAKEVAKDMPTAVTLACNDKTLGSNWQKLLHSKTFRVYLSNDYIGVQLAGAMKNVIAIGVGVSDGLGFGANARAALITRGLNEMRHLGRSFQASEKTFMGLTGLGDLLLTATDNQSRNRRFGLALGQGLSTETALDEIGQVVEGRHNAIQVCSLGKEMHIELPICSVVSQLINHQLTPQLAVEQLLSRPPTYE